MSAKRKNRKLECADGIMHHHNWATVTSRLFPIPVSIQISVRVFVQIRASPPCRSNTRRQNSREQAKVRQAEVSRISQHRPRLSRSGDRAAVTTRFTVMSLTTPGTPASRHGPGNATQSETPLDQAHHSPTVDPLCIRMRPRNPCQ